MRELGDNTAAKNTVGDEFDGQRLDNYLLREWRGAPRSLVYRLIRGGHVRVNGGRAKPDARLRAGDTLRLPRSVRLSPRPPAAAPLELPVLFEDSHYLAVDKPAGLAVHGGSGIAHGAIERLRAARPAAKFLELAHRLDRDTSGVLLLAKKRAALAAVQEQWRERRVSKAYIALVFGAYNAARHARIESPLARTSGADGRRHVVVSAAGKTAVTRARQLTAHTGGCLLGASIETGRTHQLRVHFASEGLPIVGDDKYGDFAANRAAAKAGHARLFLHAERLRFYHPHTDQRVAIHAPLPPAFAAAGDWLHHHNGAAAPANALAK